MSESIPFFLGKGYVLAVEDSLVQAKRLEHFFKAFNIKYKLFANAEEALVGFSNEEPELVISDIVMPGMDGYEFCRTIKSTKAYSKIPVILLTSLQDPHDIIKGLQAGADNFITKPFDDKYLYSRIQYLLINRDMQYSGDEDKIIELVFRGEKYQITSDKKQILDLLLSVYEAAIQRNNELTQTKAQLESAYENLKKANQDLDAFSRTVSHDLKTPLNAIIGFTEILLMQDDSNLDENAKELLEIINKSAWSMSGLIQDLLQFSMSGQVEIEQEPVNLTQIASQVMENILLREGQKKMKVIIERNLHAKADPKMIQVVFENLLGNAVKYSGLKEYPEIVFGKKDYFGQDLFFVQDNGAGFDMNLAHKLFQPFQRLHSSDEFKGTGVGLSTVQRIIERHGGQIWADSEKGKGATFFFTLNN
jgi:signal transduction histidine kinase